MDNLPILLAEDNEDDVFLMRRAFTKARLPNPLRVVADGEQVLAYLKGEGEYSDRDQHPFPALLLMDIKMPKMDGLETLSAIRNDSEFKRLVVIFLTSSKQAKDINQAFDLHANSYLVKPPNTERMVDALGKINDYWMGLNHYPTLDAGPAVA